MDIQLFLTSWFLGNTGRQWTEAAVVFMANIVILWIFKKIVLNWLRTLAKRTKTDWDDYAITIIDSLHWPFYLLVSVYTASHFLTLHPTLAKYQDYLLLFIVSYYIVKAMMLIIEVSTEKYIKRMEAQEKDHDPSVIHVLSLILKAIVCIIAVIFLLSNFGVNISALIAGLGIGGIAIAFALQNVLSDIFASFSIYFDKPFKVGDNIQIGLDQGIVKKIGIKTTRIQTTQGQELIVSNKELTTVRINNFKRMQKRQVTFNLWLSYDNERAKVKKVPIIVKNAVSGIKGLSFSRATLKSLAESSMVFEIVYVVPTPDGEAYLDAQDKINFALIEEFGKERISFSKTPIVVPKA